LAITYQINPFGTPKCIKKSRQVIDNYIFKFNYPFTTKEGKTFDNQNDQQIIKFLKPNSFLLIYVINIKKILNIFVLNLFTLNNISQKKK
jgi:hypothetical protein